MISTFILLSLSVVAVQAYNIPASAQCVADQSNCSEEVSKQSGICLALVKVSRQPEGCIKTACKYCNWPVQQNSKLCTGWALKHWCKNFQRAPTSIAKPTAEPELEVEERKDPETCVWKGLDDCVVISLSNARLSSEWTKNGNGLIWRKDALRGIDRKGTGSKCFHFKVPSDGNYYMTAITSAPHVVDHNDMWIKLSSGVAMYRVSTGVHRYSSRDYIKGYQNQGKDIKTNVLSNVDRKPHYMVSNFMKKGEPYEVCISGRSSKFTIYKIVFVKCNPNIIGSCSPYEPHIRNYMSNLSDSEC